jgi:hypothetical protein
MYQVTRRAVSQGLLAAEKASRNRQELQICNSMRGGNLGRDARTFSSSDALVQDGLWQTATHWWSVVEEGIVPHHVKSCSSRSPPFFVSLLPLTLSGLANSRARS